MSERCKIGILGFASYLSGYVSVICGYSLLSYLVFAFAYYIFSDPSLLSGRSWRVFLFEMLRPAPLAYLLGWIGIAAVTGGFGYGLVYRHRRHGKITLAAAAARLAGAGLVGAALDLVILTLMLGYRAYRWFG
jgi:hypothetical protein